MEGRNIAINDITSAFLHTYMVHSNFIVRVRLCGVLEDLLVKMDQSKIVDKFVLEGGKKVMYAILKKALYGALIVSILFWQ